MTIGISPRYAHLRDAKPIAYLVLVVLVVAAAIAAGPQPADAATSPCVATASNPTVSGGQWMNMSGRLNCTGTGKTAVSISNRVYRQAAGIWSQWGGTNSQPCNAGQVNCLKSTGWFCDGAGNNNWKSWTEGKDNDSNTKADWSSVVARTC